MLVGQSGQPLLGKEAGIRPGKTKGNEMKYTVDFYKIGKLSPDERNAQRKNQSGIWLCTGFAAEAESPRRAIAMAKAQENVPLGVNCGYRLRARRA